MADPAHQVIGRYAIFDEIASGGMATVHIGRLLGPVGFSRTVAIKRLHPQFAKDPDFVSMFVDEARLAARIRHPNVVPTLDVVKTDTELFLVMDYVQGESLSRLMRHARRDGKPMDPRLVVPVMAGVLHGLHAAHTAKGERGEPLCIVHRDVSPQNILVGCDGVARVFDFGIAKARGRLQTTRDGQIKGKLAYMAPEQLSGAEVGPTSDVYSAAVVLWECLSGQRLFDGDTEALLLAQVLGGVQYPPSAFNPSLATELDQIVMMGLKADASHRFASARAMAVALERSHVGAPSTEVGEWVEEMATTTLHKRSERIAEIESQSEIRVLGRDDPESATPRPSFPGASEPNVNSQLSSISVSRAPLAARERSGRALPMAVGAALALLAAGLAAFFLRTAPEPPPAAAPPPPTEPPPPLLAPPASAPPAVASATAAPSASSSAEQPIAERRPPTPRPWRPPNGKLPAPRPAPKAPNCSPAFWIDADGIRHPKPECL